MDWFIVIILCVVSCWVGMFFIALFSSSKRGDCKSKEFNDVTLRCKNCGTNDLHITNRFKFTDNTEDFVVICHTCGTEYEINNNVKRIMRSNNDEN